MLGLGLSIPQVAVRRRGGAGAPDNTLTLIPLYGQSLALGVDPDGSAIVSVEANKTITGATQANPVVVTSVGHGFADGAFVYIAGVGGMTAINFKSFVVASATADTFALSWHDGESPSLTPVDGTAFGAYTSGGAAARVIASATHKMFNGGMRPHYDDPSQANVNTHAFADTMKALDALRPQMQRADSDYGETYAAGMGLNITRPCIFAAMARSAYRIDQLSRNTLEGYLHFSNAYAAVLHGRELALAAGKLFDLGPMLFKQGEADGAAATTKALYKSRHVTLRNDFEAALRWAALDDVSPFRMLIDQQALSTAGYAEIAVAQIELHREHPGEIICAGPTYWCTFSGATDPHMTVEGYRTYGEHLGRIAQTILAGGAWQPCHITGTPTRVGATITVPVYVPTPPLVVDTTLVATVASKGFAYSGAAITDVSITDTGAGDNTGVITVALDAAAGGTLSHAYNNGAAGNIGPTTGARGNIRDSNAAVAAYDGRPLHNWLCVDQWTVA